MTIAELIAQENAATGPFALSGGQTHKLSPQDAVYVAENVASASGSWAIPIVIICAYVRGESRFDFDAINPNRELAPNGKWPDAQTEAAHTDYGLCQVNGDGSYLGRDAVRASLNYLCKAIIENVMWSAVHHLPVEVGYEAYNKGRSGALSLYNQGSVAACAYGRLIVQRIDDYVKLGVI